mgnify:CR=1 FL=1
MRPGSAARRNPGSVVSIHAPVKGATSIADGAGLMRNGFNPRTREGCDCGGVDLPRSLDSFNPRTREGCDFDNPYTFKINFVSIHAPVKGATELGDYGFAAQFVSIHAPVKGATSAAQKINALNQFQSTHP